MTATDTATYLLCGGCDFGTGGCGTLHLLNSGSGCDACTHAPDLRSPQ